jgi:hypothetical protein
MRIPYSIAFTVGVALACLATAWAHRLWVAPFGNDIAAFTSDASYFEWAPTEATSGMPPELLIGTDHPIRMRPLQLGSPPIGDIGGLVRRLIGAAPNTVSKIDSLMAWWRARFARFPTYEQVIPDLIPLDLPALRQPRSVILCLPQAQLFRLLLLSQDVQSRIVGIHTSAKCDLQQLDGAPHSGHSLLETWVPEIEQWILVDPMLGVRYVLDGKPLSLRDMLALRRLRALDDATVVYAGVQRVPYAEHGFSTRYLGTDNISELFNFGEIGYWPAANAGADPFVSMFEDVVLSPTGVSTSYYLYWSPDAGAFEPMRCEVRRYRLKVAANVALWLGALGCLAFAYRARRKSRSSDGPMASSDGPAADGE